MTPELIREARFSLHVYPERGQPHHLPHCHIRRRDGTAETVISLISLDVLAGPPPSTKEAAVLKASQEDLIDEWERQHE